MKLFKCDVKPFTIEIIELPRHSWRHLGPRKWQVVLTVAVILVGAILWGLL